VSVGVVVVVVVVVVAYEIKDIMPLTRI